MAQERFSLKRAKCLGKCNSCWLHFPFTSYRILPYLLQRLILARYLLQGHNLRQSKGQFLFFFSLSSSVSAEYSASHQPKFILVSRISCTCDSLATFSPEPSARSVWNGFCWYFHYLTADVAGILLKGSSWLSFVFPGLQQVLCWTTLGLEMSDFHLFTIISSRPSFYRFI